jgi:hypothetical protein
LELSTLKRFFGLAVGLFVLIGFLASADATIKIQIAEVQNGMAFVKGNGAIKESPITWVEAPG